MVRLAAAGINGRAWAPDERSALTSALLAELAAAGDAPSWVALFAGIERRLVLAGLRQQPRLSGPVRRRVFSLAEALPPGAVPVRRDGDRIILEAGQQHGVRRGDLFLVDTPFNHKQVCHVDGLAPDHAVLHPRGPDMSLESGDSIATGHMSLGTDHAARHRAHSPPGPDPSASRAHMPPGTDLPSSPGHLSRGPDCFASPSDLSFGPDIPPTMSLGPAAYALPLRLRGHGGVVLTGPAAPTAAPALRRAGWEIDPSAADALATLECSATTIVVHPADAPACITLPAGDLAGALAVLQRLARSARLRHLGAGNLGALTMKAAWGRVHGGACEFLPPRGAEPRRYLGDLRPPRERRRRPPLRQRVLARRRRRGRSAVPLGVDGHRAPAGHHPRPRRSPLRPRPPRRGPPAPPARPRRASPRAPRRRRHPAPTGPVELRDAPPHRHPAPR
ncbi:hypothetical protein [Nannocystis pusilla]|uniref:hypothetical protein n=1 Tax=Nannocystis pusilla TaxID=889268 RepID=UPI003DA45593